MLRYYQDFDAASLAALEATGRAPPPGAVVKVDLDNLAASAMRTPCVFP